MMDQHVDEMTSYLDWSDKGKASFGAIYWDLCSPALSLFVLGSVVVMPLSAIKPDYPESPSFSLIGTLLSFLVLFVAIPFIVALLHRRPDRSAGNARAGVPKPGIYSLASGSMPLWALWWPLRSILPASCRWNMSVLTGVSCCLWP